MPKRNFIDWVDKTWKKAAGPTQKTPNPRPSTPVQVVGTKKTYPNKAAYNKSLKKKYPKSNIPKDKI